MEKSHVLSMESQSQYPEFRNNPENLHIHLYYSTSLIQCLQTSTILFYLLFGAAYSGFPHDPAPKLTIKHLLLVLPFII